MCVLQSPSSRGVLARGRGLTAAILIEAARRAFAREPEFAEHAGRPFRDLWWDGQQVAYRQRSAALL